MIPARVEDLTPEWFSKIFVKLQPFVAEQRKFLRQIGLGVAEARLYANIGAELPVRAPRVWHADYDESEGAFVMVLEDLQASGCHVTVLR